MHQMKFRLVAAFALSFMLTAGVVARDCTMTQSGGTCTAECSSGTLSLSCGEKSCSSSCTSSQGQKAGTQYLSNVYRDLYLSGGKQTSSGELESLFTEQYKGLRNGSGTITLDGKKYNVYISPPTIETVPMQQRSELAKELGKVSTSDLQSKQRFDIKIEQFKLNK